MEDAYCNRGFYRGYTPRQLDEMIERDQAEKGKKMAEEMQFPVGRSGVVPLQKIVPTLATLDTMALEQIRAVVREELQAAMKPPVIWNAEAISSEELAERLKDWKPTIQVTHYELSPEERQSIVEDVKRSLAREAFLKGQRRIV